MFTPLWGKAPRRVVEEEIDAGLDIRLVHLAADPLGRELLGRRLDRAMLDRLEQTHRGPTPVHLAGEGGIEEEGFVERAVEHQRSGQAPVAHDLAQPIVFLGAEDAAELHVVFGGVGPELDQPPRGR